MYTTSTARAVPCSRFTEGLRVRAAAWLLTLLTVMGAVAGCGSAGTGTPLAQMQDLAKTCPAQQLVQYVGDDVSGSGQQASITATREGVLRDIVTRVAACGGHLHIDAFTGSASASQVVFDSDLRPAGATQIARLRKVSSLVDATMKSIDRELAAATKALSPDGSDITSQFGLAAEFYRQISATRKASLSVDLLTDGVQTAGTVLNTQALTTATAADLASTAAIVTLPHSAAVKISGLGKTTGTAPPTAYTDALKTFYLAYCHRTGAASCVAVTDYTE